MDRRNILMNHFTQPTNFGLVEANQTYQTELHSPACSDELTIQIFSHDNILDDLHFTGSACVVATSATDILFTMLKGRTFIQAMDLLTRYQTMILQGSEPDDDFKELVVFDNIHRQKGRWKCATLASEGVLEFLSQKSAL